MKKIFIILFFTFLLIFDCNSQVKNRFTVLFKEADVAFNQQYGNNNDSIDLIVFKEIDLLISGNNQQITLSVDQLLLFYWNGYINGSINSLEKGRVDLITLKYDIISNKKSIINFLQMKYNL